MVASTLKLGIAGLNGGNSTVQQVSDWAMCLVYVQQVSDWVMCLVYVQQVSDWALRSAP